MASRVLSQLLFRLNRVERYQKKTGQNFNYDNLDFIHHPIPRMPQFEFFQESNIAITKNNRFSYTPAHTHDFIEFNYMYSGSCTQYINDEPIVLRQHQLLVMDRDVVQRIDYAGQKDVIINILLRDTDDFAESAGYVQNSADTVSQFLYNAAKQDSPHNNFIIFDLSKNEVATKLLESLAIKGLEDTANRNELLRLIFAALMVELPGTIRRRSISYTNPANDEFLPILRAISAEYQTVSHGELATRFGYNTNYLGDKIREMTGKSFKELIDRRRLAAAQNLMIRTSCSAAEICDIVGYKNNTSLFRLFKKYLDTTPSAYKAKVSHQRLITQPQLPEVRGHEGRTPQN